MVLKSIARTFQILSEKFRFKSIYLLVGIIINSLFDIIGLAAILPVLASILKPEFIQENQFTSEVYKYFEFQDERVFILFLCTIIFIFIIMKNLFGIWIQKKQVQFCWNIHEELSVRVLKKVFNKGYSYFTNNNSNLVLNRISRIPLMFAQNLLLQIIQYMNEIFVLILVLASLLVYDFVILLILTAVIVPFFFIFFQYNKKRITRYNHRINELEPLIAKPIYEIVFGYVDVVIGGVFEMFQHKYLTSVKEAKKLRTRVFVIQSIPSRLIEICVIMALITMLLYGIFVLEKADSILTLLSIFGLAAYRTIPSINRLMLATLNIKGQGYCLDILEDLFNNNANQETKDSIEVSFNERIKIDRIDYLFPDAEFPILDNYTLEIEKGETIGIVGKSGSGKTTLLNLLLGFLKPTGGQIIIDNNELNEKNTLSWQKKIGYVRQDVFLIDGTLLANVAFGIPNEKIDLDKFHQVIERAHLKKFMGQLPDKEQTNIGERGAKVSGGQRQRIGIARALYHGAEVLFFDEATSALDTETEKEITAAINSLHSDKLTMIIVAHRESTLKYCDRIIDLSKK